MLSVAFSSDNRQIVSGSRDKTIKLWNTLGVCKYTVQVKWGHTQGTHVEHFLPSFWLYVVISSLFGDLKQFCQSWLRVWVLGVWTQGYQNISPVTEGRVGDLELLSILFSFHPLQDESHSEWVSCVRFSPNSSNPIIVSCGWDKLVKVSLEPGCRAFIPTPTASQLVGHSSSFESCVPQLTFILLIFSQYRSLLFYIYSEVANW